MATDTPGVENLRSAEVQAREILTSDWSVVVAFEMHSRPAMRIARLWIGLVSLVGCADRAEELVVVPEASASGLSLERAIDDLDPLQVATLCTWWMDELGGPGHSVFCDDCNNGGCTEHTATVNDVQTCVSQHNLLLGCDLTVADIEACGIALGANLCSSPTECDAIEICADL